MRKSVKRTLIGLGIFIALLTLINTSAIVYAGINVYHFYKAVEQFTEEANPAVAEKATPVKEIEEKEPKETLKVEKVEEVKTEEIEEKPIIKDLAYIEVMTAGYTDDADPEDDGIAVDIEFYNSKSEHIDFEDIPVTVNIKIYATKLNWDTGEDEIIEPPVYEGNVEVDHSMRMSEMLGGYIRIPYEDFGAIPDKEYPWGKALVTVITPLQGEFKAEAEMVRLAPYY